MENPTKEPVLTKRQQYWLQHLETAKAQNIPLTQYAKENDLGLPALYNARSSLKSKGVIEGSSVSPFIRVQPAKSIDSGDNTFSSGVTICFPNGTQILIEFNEKTLPSLLSTVKSL